jgi:hypothetical protein
VGSKDVYAKGIMLSDAIASIDLSKIDNLGFVVIRAADGYSQPLSGCLDGKFGAHYEQAKALGLPVFVWMRVYPKMYADTGWDINNYNRWAVRKNEQDSNEDFALAIMDRLLGTRDWWHGLIYSVYMGAYNSGANTYDVSASWAQAVAQRVRDLGKQYYGKMSSAANAPERFFWPEFSTGIIDNRLWDVPGALDTWVKDIELSVWMSAGFPVQTVSGRLDLNALPWPDDPASPVNNIPTYSKLSRSNCLWRAANTTVYWDGAKTAAGGAAPVPIYLMYATLSSLRARFGISAPPVNPGGGEPGGGDTGGGETPVASAELIAAIDRNTAEVQRAAAALEKLAGVLK